MTVHALGAVLIYNKERLVVGAISAVGYRVAGILLPDVLIAPNGQAMLNLLAC